MSGARMITASGIMKTEDQNMTNQQHLTRLATETAGQLRRLGCQVLAATAINGRSWIKAKLPDSLSPKDRIHILASARQAPAIVEWRVK